jgi:two-component system, NtrC family, sensor kinase
MKYFFIFLFSFPLAAFSQKSNVFKLSAKKESATKFASGWIALDSGWKFKAGDNLDWAKSDFNDSSWQPVTLFQNLYDSTKIPKSGIVWLRLHFITDSSLNQQLVMRIYQTGASQAYLNGKLIQQLGTVSSNPDSVKYYSPNFKNLSFPVQHDAVQTLAIRFAVLPNKYPIYMNPLKTNLEVWVSTVNNAEEDNIVHYYRSYGNRINIAIGVSSVLFVLYLSFFIFFPTQKINLYFSLLSFFFSLFLILNSAYLYAHAPSFKMALIAIGSTAIYLLLFLYCIYKIFNQKFGWFFWLIFFLGIISFPAPIFITGDIISPLLGILALIDILRVSIKSLRTNRAGAGIILFFMGIDLIYWTFSLLSNFSIIHIPYIETYAPFAFMLGPLSLAIYLGYDFAKTSQSLRQKLTEVEQLSNEKQQILSAQNVTLEKQVAERTAELKQSLENLKSTQAQLIQSEKMASLGELTAGIAHEIQNPLNFVNNFSDVNKEMLVELNEEIEKGNYDDAKSIAKDVIENEEKINHHGKRADAIVKGMLQHSRQTKGIKEPTDINALCDEYLRLSYHGLRAKDKNFNADFKTDFDETIGKINIVPQDIGRVLLNLFNNAFYAVNEKKKLMANGYQPIAEVKTRRINDKVEIIVSDNGNGIPQNIIDKIFQPFFTTKPTGQGTGLGLSLAYDIITNQHNGTIKVESKEGEGTVFLIQLRSV